MRLKQKVALLLASVMLVGSIGIMNPTEVRAADATNTFTLTVPADTNITTSGWNDIGSVGVSNVSIASGKKISVTIGGGATERTLKKTGEVSKTVGYEIKKGNATTNEAFGTSLDFTADGTQPIGANVSSFTGKPAGNYTDTITFTAKLEDKVTALTNASGKTLAAADLGAPSEFTVNGKTYYAYNDFIKKTSGSNWDDAMNFVKMLNVNKYDGHDDWQLLGSKEMATAWYNEFSTVNRGEVDFLWSSVGDGTVCAYYLRCDDQRGWYSFAKSYEYSYCGFVVLRGPSNASAPTEVTYARAGKEALSSANLGTPTSWTYNGVTYDVYNEFIPSSSDSSWNDAVGFVAALNDAEYDGHSDWTLLSSAEMAIEWYNQFGSGGASAVDCGDVEVLWSSVEDVEGHAYYLDCYLVSWDMGDDKSYANSICGFVVLRGSSN